VVHAVLWVFTCGAPSGLPALIWAALVIYAGEGLWPARKQRRAFA
jgi:hypothetical protein